VLDACVLINLEASAEMQSILEAEHASFAVVDAVIGEALFLRAEDEGQDHEPIDVRRVVRDNGLEVLSIGSTEETELFVNLAAELDDGEAMSMAIAIARSFRFATDDKKARRVFAEVVNDPARLVSTPSLVRKWAERFTKNEESRVAGALRRIRSRARFVPPASDPDYDWWMTQPQ